MYAGMVKLADTIDLGSIASACRFESCCPHQFKINKAEPFVKRFRFCNFIYG